MVQMFAGKVDWNTMNTTRRQFMKQTGASAAALGLAAAGINSKAHAARTYGISLAGWSLHRTIGEGDDHVPMLDMPKMARQDFGIEAIELVNRMLASHQGTFAEQKPYLDTLEFRFIPETSALIGAFRAREVDVITPPPFIPDLLGLADLDGVELTIATSPIWEHFNFQFGPNNRNEDSLNRYVEFRRAIAYALDRDAIVAEILRGFGYAMDSYVEAFTPGLSTGAWRRYPHDPQAAQTLLADLCAELERDCVTDPPRLVFSTTSNGDVRTVVANLLERQLEEVGIDVELDLEDSSLFFGSTLDRGTWDMGLWAWVGSPGMHGLVAIHDVFDPDGPPPDGMNFYRWGTPAVAGSDEPTFDQGPSLVRDEHTARFAEIVDAMNATIDHDEIVALVQEAEGILAHQVVIIPLYSRLDPGAVWADEIGGYVHNPSQASDLWNVEYWYRVIPEG